MCMGWIPVAGVVGGDDEGAEPALSGGAGAQGWKNAAGNAVIASIIPWFSLDFALYLRDLTHWSLLPILALHHCFSSCTNNLSSLSLPKPKCSMCDVLECFCFFPTVCFWHFDFGKKFCFQLSFFFFKVSSSNQRCLHYSCSFLL